MAHAQESGGFSFSYGKEKTTNGFVGGGFDSFDNKRAWSPDGDRCASVQPFVHDAGIQAAKELLVSTMREEAENLRTELQDSLDHCRRLQWQIERESETRAQHEKNLEADLEKRTKEVDDLQNLISSLKEENEKRKQTERTQSDQIVQLQLLIEKEKESRARSEKNVEVKLGNRIKEVDEMKTLVSSLKQENEKLKRTERTQSDEILKLQRQIEKEAESSAQRVKNIQTDLDKRIKEVDELRASMSSLKEENEQRKRTERKQSEEILQLQLRMEKMKDVQVELEKRIREVNDLQSQISPLKRENEQRKHVERTQSDEILQLQLQVEKEKDSKAQREKNFQVELEKRTREVNDLQILISSLKRENEKQKQKEYTPCEEIRRRRLFEEASEMRKLKGELDSAIAEKKALQLAWMELDGQLEAMAKIKDGYQTRTVALEEEVAALIQELNKLKDHHQHGKNMQADLEKRIKDMDEMNILVSSLKQENEKQKQKECMQAEEIRELQRQLEREVESRVQREKNFQAELEKRWKIKEAEFNKLRDEHQAKVTALENMTPIMDQRYDDMVKRLRMTEERLGEMRRDNQILQGELDDARAKLVKAEFVTPMLNQKYDEMVMQLRKTEERLGDLNRENQMLQDELDDAVAKLKKAESRTPLTDQRYEDLATRLRTTEESLGEMRRDNQILQGELDDTLAKLEKVETAYNKLYTGMRDTVDKIALYKKEKEYFEKLYDSYKEKTQVEMMQKDSKIAQQDKLITHLQTRISGPKKMCCWVPDKKPVGRLSMDELGQALDLERAKNVELTGMVRRLQQQLNEKRMRRSFSEERLPVVKEK